MISYRTHKNTHIMSPYRWHNEGHQLIAAKNETNPRFRNTLGLRLKISIFWWKLICFNRYKSCSTYWQPKYIYAYMYEYIIHVHHLHTLYQNIHKQVQVLWHSQFFSASICTSRILVAINKSSESRRVILEGHQSRNKNTSYSVETEVVFTMKLKLHIQIIILIGYVVSIREHH